MPTATAPTVRTAVTARTLRWKAAERTAACPPGGRRVGPASRCRRASQMRIAAPNSVVTTPVGMSTPACPPSTARSSTSEPSTMMTPAMPDNGSRIRCRCTPGTTRGEQPDDHRGAQADETDRAGEGDGRGGQQHGQHHDGEPGAPHVETEHGGGVVAEGEDVEAVPEQHQHHDGADDHRGQLGQRRQVALHQRAVAPGEQTDGGLLEQQQQQGGHRRRGPARSPSRRG